MNAFFNDSLEDLIGRPMRAAPTEPPANSQPAVFTENCPKCRGTGAFRSYSGRLVGPCFHCKGAGKLTFKTSTEQRAASRAKAQERADAEYAEVRAGVAEFRADRPAIWAWIQEAKAGFEFARAMDEALAKWGHLTEKQLAACQKCVDAQAAQAAARTERETNAPTIAISRIEDAFASASAKGIKRPALNLDTFKFKPASAHSKNAGSIYVTEDEQYLGRISGGKFICTRECGEERQARVVAAAADPEAAAVAYGKRFGTCSCCGRTLTNGISIDRGIGPICANKYGW